MRNAVRLCVFRRQITSAQREKALYELEKDLASGVLHAAPLDWPKALKHAEALGRHHTELIGSRGMDLLHVASALDLERQTVCHLRRPAAPFGQARWPGRELSEPAPTPYHLSAARCSQRLFGRENESTERWSALTSRLRPAGYDAAPVLGRAEALAKAATRFDSFALTSAS